MVGATLWEHCRGRQAGQRKDPFMERTRSTLAQLRSPSLRSTTEFDVPASLFLFPAFLGNGKDLGSTRRCLC